MKRQAATNRPGAPLFEDPFALAHVSDGLREFAEGIASIQRPLTQQERASLRGNCPLTELERQLGRLINEYGLGRDEFRRALADAHTAVLECDLPTREDAEHIARLLNEIHLWAQHEALCAVADATRQKRQAHRRGVEEKTGINYAARDADIRRRRRLGETAAVIGNRYQISADRVRQITGEKSQKKRRT